MPNAWGIEVLAGVAPVLRCYSHFHRAKTPSESCGHAVPGVITADDVQRTSQRRTLGSHLHC
jgi:hypothetical protein